MRVHQRATKRKIAPGDGPDHFISSQMKGNAHKKLRRLPHVFSKVLELPFRSDADVAVEEGPDFFRFIAKIEVDDDVVVGDVRAHAVEIHPGVIKIVVRNDQRPGGCDHVDLSLDKLEVDTWRFRLPSSTRPELATAAFIDGELVVTVPKGGLRCEFVDEGEVWGGGNRVILVQ
ncbi:hypothetical protein BUALT_Bualt14G0094300 [Buddleja alternifolia]|uniref:SHSP domain-containing protein n=1 Tax=Buddleja alternifolia TaxID=168488 RepID=A0AAV6WQY0_9LAMI|nr:hypothetical protein BUALT_Bualt14G0094300 [Buddleja alternifolia]